MGHLRALPSRVKPVISLIGDDKRATGSEDQRMLLKRVQSNSRREAPMVQTPENIAKASGQHLFGCRSTRLATLHLPCPASRRGHGASFPLDTSEP